MNRYALLVGNSNYEDPALRPLPSAVRDVKALQQVLINPEIGGFAESDVKMLRDVDRNTIESAVYRLFADRKRDDLLLFYFSGHGLTEPKSKDFYLTTSKTLESEAPPSSVWASYIHRQMNNSNSKCKVIILDCCFSGAFTKGMKGNETLDIVPQFAGEGRAVLTASNSSQYAFEEPGYELSLYTHFLVEGLKTGEADLNKDGNISVFELHEYVEEKVTNINDRMSPQFDNHNKGREIILAKAALNNSFKFRKEVEEFAHDGNGELSIFAKVSLEVSRQKLGLAPVEAETIINEVLRPYQEYAKKLEVYEQALRDAIAHKFPFSKVVQAHLQKCENRLLLQEEDLQAIKERILVPKQAEYEQQLQHQAAQRQEEAQRLKQQQEEAERQLQAAEAKRLQRQQAELQERLKQQQEAAERQRQAEAERLRRQQAELQNSEADLGLRPEEIKTTNNRLRPKTLIKPPDLTVVTSVISRRNFLTFLGLAGGGLGGALVLSNIKFPNISAPKNIPPPTSKAFTFDVVKVDGTGKEIERKSSQVESLIYDFGNGITLDMVNIPAGEFMMGMPTAERQIALDNYLKYGGKKEDAEKDLDWSTPPHKVTIKEAFWMGKFTVTNALWNAVMGTEPSKQFDVKFQGKNQPVVGVSWHDCNKFCKELSVLTGKEFRLPTEAEWEYACRANTTTPFHFGDTITPDLVNYNSYFSYGNAPKGEYRKKTVDVGSFSSNAWGLYQMHGNVWEWCLDEWHDNYSSKPESLKDNGSEPWGEIKVADNYSRSCLVRGGSWVYGARECRSAFRSKTDARLQYLNNGFRVVCRLQ